MDEDMASCEAKRNDRTTMAISWSENSRTSTFRASSSPSPARASIIDLIQASTRQVGSSPLAIESLDLAATSMRIFMASFRAPMAAWTLVPGRARGKLTSSSARVMSQYFSPMAFSSSWEMCSPQKTRRETSMFRSRMGIMYLRKKDCGKVNWVRS